MPRSKETVGFQRKTPHLDHFSDIILLHNGFLHGCYHLWLLRLILIKPVVRMVLLWLNLKVMTWNLFGWIVLCGYCMNLLGVFPVQLNHFSCQERVQHLQWHGLGRMSMTGINVLLIRYAQKYIVLNLLQTLKYTFWNSHKVILLDLSTNVTFI